MKIEIGLMLLLHGSKSGKLDRAFRLLNAEKRNGSFGEWSVDEQDVDTFDIMLNSFQLKALFEAFLTAIVASVASSNEVRRKRSDSEERSDELEDRMQQGAF